MPTTDGGEITAGRLLRSDNLQALTTTDIDRLLELGLSDVVDLRSEYEVESEGPGPLAGHPRGADPPALPVPRVARGRGRGEAGRRGPRPLPDEALPWVDLTPTVTAANPVASIYLSYVVDRPDSIVASLRHIGQADGATLVHCAAGKDRTGTVVALALSRGRGRPRRHHRRLRRQHRADGGDRRAAAGLPDVRREPARPADVVPRHPPGDDAGLPGLTSTSEYGGAEPLLGRMGWTDADSERLRAKLRG